jgi:hypothetical protein
MGQRCTICLRKDRQKIDESYATDSNRSIASRFHLSTGAVARHKKHIKAAIAKVEERAGRSFADYFMEMWDQAIAEYKLAGNSMEKATWFRERRGLLETGARLGMQRQQEGRLYTGLDGSVKEVWDGLDDRS